MGLGDITQTKQWDTGVEKPQYLEVERGSWVRNKVEREPRKIEYSIVSTDNFLDLCERECRHFCLVMSVFSVK